MTHLEVGGLAVEYRRIEVQGASTPAIVMLHEGLGSVSLWKDFPERLAAATGHPVYVYSRSGHGRSRPRAERRRPDFMHAEALQYLPMLLDAWQLERPWLFGHSDGGSIALIHAARGQRPVSGLVVLAPHVMVEDLTVQSIAAAREQFAATDLRERLGRHHSDPEHTFRAWNDIWLDPAFADWNIESLLPDIRCPVLAIQGEDDEYGTMAQIERIGAAVPLCRLLKLADCGHSPHRDQPQAVLEATRCFIREADSAP
jgi:pimeloyl-ACP methyl ester carboxylesterase